jgi:hypothetical protein
MGYMTLDQLRAEVSSNLSEVGYDNDRLDTWINLGYIEVATAMEPDRFTWSACATFAQRGRSFVLPQNTVAVRSVVDKTHKRRLVYVSPENFELLESGGRAGYPQRWTRLGSTIRVWPEPYENTDVRLLLIREPLRLVLATDVTEISARWDAAVMMMATRYAFMGVRNIKVAEDWLQMASATIRSRQSESWLEANTFSEGVWVPQNEHELYNLREDRGVDG